MRRKRKEKPETVEETKESESKFLQLSFTRSSYCLERKTAED